MKKMLTAVLSLAILTAAFSGCALAEAFNGGKSINVITRESGSGTRGAFIELFGLEEKLEDGSKKDMITKEANVESSTNAILMTVQSDAYAIGYISMGSLNDDVKALQIEGVDATVENVKSGAYAISRPFIIATKGEATGLAKDFIDFILSKEGQDVVGKSYIAASDDAPAYQGGKPGGEITVGGSSSVSPLMEKLIEAYSLVNPNGKISLQTSDSTTGMAQTAQGAYDIGMSSRELKDSEKETLTDVQIAIDGIAVIVNKRNTTVSLKKDDVKNIYLGTTLTWDNAVAQ